MRDSDALTELHPVITHSLTTINKLLSAPGGLPGRAATKRLLRSPIDSKYFGTEALVQADVDLFIQSIIAPSTQSMLSVYLKSLSSKKKA